MRPRPARLGRHRALERREQAVALRSYSARESASLLVDPPAARGLLEEPLSERARALVGVLLRGDEPGRDVGGADCPAEPDPGKHRLRSRARLHDDVRSEAPEARERVVGEAELAVRDVLDDQESVAARELDERRAPLGGEADARRVLVVGDAVERASAAGRSPSCRSSSSTSSPCSSIGTATSFASKLRNAWIAPR